MANKLSVQDVDYEEIQNILVDPLSNREVMIPFTGKAFMAGTLRPPIVSHEKRDKDSREKELMEEEDEEDEEVVVRIGADIFIPMIRSEALLWLDKRRIDRNETSQKVKEDADVIHLNSKDVSFVKPTKGAQITNIHPNDDELASSFEHGDFFDIREEYDENGQPIRAEAINVAKELKYLETGNDLSRGISHGIPSNRAKKTTESNSEEGVSSMIDEEFSRLSLRLDELARLEEEMEYNTKQKINNPQSSKTLQGTGWKKGFLTKQSSKKTTAIRNTKDGSNDTKSKKKVGFGVNSVHEIPRVGEKSFSGRNSSLSSLPSKRLSDIIQEENLVTQPESSATFNAMPSGTQELISEQVFNGNVSERKPTVDDGNQNNHSNKPERKLSRFAQQRMRHYEEETKSK